MEKDKLSYEPEVLNILRLYAENWLVAIRLPEETINERRRKENKKAAAKGKILTALELELLAWNIIITSIPRDMLTIETMCEIYRIRWLFTKHRASVLKHIFCHLRTHLSNYVEQQSKKV